MGSIILILSPRIFANSFYNNKDLVFFIFLYKEISSYYSLKLIENQNFKNMLKFSFSTLTIDIRILRFFLVALNIFLCDKNIYQNVLIKDLIITISTLLLSSIFTILFGLICGGTFR